MNATRKRKSRKRKNGKTKRDVPELQTLEGGSDPTGSIERSLEDQKTSNTPKAVNGRSPPLRGNQTPNTSIGIGHQPGDTIISLRPDWSNGTDSSDILAHSQVPEGWNFTPDNHQEYGFEAFLASPANLYNNIYSMSHPFLALIQDYLIFIRSALCSLLMKCFRIFNNGQVVPASSKEEEDQEFLRKALYWYKYREVQLKLRYGIITEEESKETLADVYEMRFPDTEEAKTTKKWEDLMGKYKLDLEGHRLWLEKFKLDNLANDDAVGDMDIETEGWIKQAAQD